MALEEGVDLYHPLQQAWHRVPDHPLVIEHFQDLGWETPDDSAARAEAEAGELRGKALNEALREAGLPMTGTADEKRAALADYAAGQIAEGDTTTEEGEA